MSNTIDLSPYYLLIATPIMDGCPDDNYAVSLDHTKQLVQRHGGSVDVFKIKYIADIAYARARLFGAFLRHEKATHMLMIDSDMGWLPQDVAYMLLLNRDFIAAVGPKRVYPIEYAYSMIGDDGKVQQLYHEVETNVAELPFVGGAFVMISRKCAEKMMGAYLDLAFNGPDGMTEFAVFDPIIIGDKRRLSEDYAFCYRWRKIGGQVLVKMDTELTHSGPHTFTGNFYNYLQSIQTGKVEPDKHD